ncbi:hypothetical protein [Nocardia sp. NPDC004722]
MTSPAEEYAEIEAILKRMRGVPRREDLLPIWERIERLDAGLPEVADRDRHLVNASERAHEHLRDAWQELGFTYETARAEYRAWAADREHPTWLSTPDRPAPQLPDAPRRSALADYQPDRSALSERPIWDGFDR